MPITNIEIAKDFQASCPDISLPCIECKVKITPRTEAFNTMIEKTILDLNKRLETGEINEIPTISATRKAYKALGKDPSRYRPSAEALLRRVTKGKGLYTINNVVDLLNLVSIETGFSIGGFDAEQIKGKVTLSVGKPTDIYEAIGRGTLNITGLPTVYDEISAFGTPTSDSVRTAVTDRTTRFLMVFYNFANDSREDQAVQLAVRLLKEFAQAKEIEQVIIRP